MSVKTALSECLGKGQAFNALVGQYMRATKGQANPVQVIEILRRKLAG